MCKHKLKLYDIQETIIFDDSHSISNIMSLRLHGTKTSRYLCFGCQKSKCNATFYILQQDYRRKTTNGVIDPLISHGSIKGRIRGEWVLSSTVVS